MAQLSRRHFLRAGSTALAPFIAGAAGCRLNRKSSPSVSISTFTADVTAPLGHPLMAGGIAPAREIIDRLQARGLVIFGSAKPIVVVAVDWCEIRNEAFARWQEVLAHAAGTDPRMVLVSSVHVHDAPVADLEAERILRSAGAAGSVIDLQFHETAVQRVALALRASLPRRQAITHIGHGLGRVDRVASNRRFVKPDGRVSFGRTSASRDRAAHEADVGIIDPMLRTVSFWQNRRPLAALHCFATHPMSFYGKGGVSSDFVGMARAMRQSDDPEVFQIYTSGCSGNVTAGRHNDGAPENRPILAKRIHEGMIRAWESLEVERIGRIGFRSVPFHLAPREGSFTERALRERLAEENVPFGQCLAAMGLSWRKRVAAGVPLDLPAVELGPVRLLLLPAEAYVEFQLFAQQQARDAFVIALGYGECAPGYIPTDAAWREGDTNLGDWCWVAPGAEDQLKSVIVKALA